MTEATTPHDAIFKAFLSRPETARDFIEIHLPPSLVKLCNLDTLHLESSSFVEENLRQYYNDVLYSVETTKGCGYIYVLIEHQSSPDENMAFRMLRYAIATMQRHLEAGHDYLPLVISILFYQGKRSPYPWSTNWLDGFPDPDIARDLYFHAFPLVDITLIPDDEIMQHRSMAAFTLVQKHIRQRDMTTLLDKLSRLMILGQMSGQQIRMLINYMALVGEAQDVRTLVHGLAQRVPQQGEELMTLAEELRRDALLNVAKAMLQRGFDLQLIMEMTGLSQEDLYQLQS
ncbi:Rpn family recombination-promoting nuclease/putative transposase [Escherichia coli]|uniref:Rpn family recombination-promoting nuclease/putative transposase n=1 Tax=Escherichia coli TaxID=562 RepID=UPI0021BFB479|nr:Rpn family recombination-promoting nuclease/putative transposase [Escherichia coli]MCT9708769.1 Rpn family recombination-promoting nuclease/putative transposase [Escherichia coli]